MEETVRINIIRLHTEYGIAYKHIAKQIGISPAYLSLWLNRNRNFSEYILERAIEKYGYLEVQ